MYEEEIDLSSISSLVPLSLPFIHREQRLQDGTNNYTIDIDFIFVF